MVGREFLIKLQVHKPKAVNVAAKSPRLSHRQLPPQRVAANCLLKDYHAKNMLVVMLFYFCC